MNRLVQKVYRGGGLRMVEQRAFDGLLEIRERVSPGRHSGTAPKSDFLCESDRS